MALLRDNIKDWLALAALPGVGCALIHRLLDVFGSPAAVLLQKNPLPGLKAWEAS